MDSILATNLRGSISLIRASLSYLRKQQGGHIIQISSYGGQVAYAANSMYHATKFGIEGFCESVAQEVAEFNVHVTIVEPGGARTEFRYGSAQVADLMPEYDHVHGFLNMLDRKRGWPSAIRPRWLPALLKASIRKTRRFIWCWGHRHCRRRLSASKNGWRPIRDRPKQLLQPIS